MERPKSVRNEILCDDAYASEAAGEWMILAAIWRDRDVRAFCGRFHAGLLGHPDLPHDCAQGSRLDGTFAMTATRWTIGWLGWLGRLG